MKKRVWIACGALLCVASIVTAIFLPKWIAPTSTQTGEFGPPADALTTTTTADSSVAAQEESSYVSPVDFASLQELNDDVYAWISIPGTSVNYPVLQHKDDDGFYVDHDSDKNPNANGAIFSERMYNALDFSDNITVLYGHNMKSGAMFGELQSVYWDEEFLRQNDRIIIYLPDREMHFEIFAALPYSRMHLLHYYPAQKQKAFDRFIDDIYSARELSAVTLDDRRPEFGDQVIVLSTCLSGNNAYRYLVMGVCRSTT